MKIRILIFSFIVATGCFITGCESDEAMEPIGQTPIDPEPPDEEEEEPDPDYSAIYRGADLSYVNEMEDCGGIYRDEEGDEIDAFQFFRDKGANLVRVRLWHNPTWTNYSNFEDVRNTISRAKEQGLEVLLDFHYSDTWADPGTQTIPAAWQDVEDPEILADSVYNYTYRTLERLQDENLLPDIVQVGNEINREILQPEENPSASINWLRNAQLINSGISAIRDFSEEIEIMLHIAQPENALWWFEEARDNGVVDFDWIGLSYYPIWSTFSMEEIPDAIQQLRTEHDKRIMIVETAYPHTLEDVDDANNILGETSLIEGYEASPEGQREYLLDLLEITTRAGAEGVVYWEPAWISTNCSTLWGEGSHWDNAALFSSDTFTALPAFDFYNPENN